MPEKIRTHRDLKVYQKAFDAAMAIFEKSHSFPKEETYSLTDQMRRSSRSTAANIAEAWRRRRFEAYFISKLSDAESEAAETQVWLEFAVKCGYLAHDTGKTLYQEYNLIINTLVGMINHPETWIIESKPSVAKTSPVTRT